VGYVLVEALLLLSVAVFIVTAFHRLHIPSSLGYLLVGVILGPYTIGPVVDGEHIRVAAEFGIVFLLFTIGLNFSLPQIYALRHLVFGLGTSQILLTTAVVGSGAWLAGLPPAAAFVVGAVFAQSSTTIISKQLMEQGEEHDRHGRLALAMSVFQDVTAVPFVVIIPVLGAAAGSLAAPLGWALAKALFAFVLIFLAGRWLLRPLFHEIAARRSAELFTLTVLLVSLASAWTTHTLGLSMAFGAFLAGMMLGDTDFRHQIESTVRPFRDVLLGLFFATIGMLFDPTLLPQIWHWSLLGAVALLLIKAVLVAQIVRLANVDAVTGWRTGIVLAVGGEFGFALLAIGLDSAVIAAGPAQITLTAVLLSMAAGPILIRYGAWLAPRAAGSTARSANYALRPDAAQTALFKDHVVICGYGRIGQSVAHFIEEESVPYVALDMDPWRVREARLAGEPVFYGDAAERDILEAAGVGAARLVLVCHDDPGSAFKILRHVRALRPDLPVMVRTRDETHVDALRQAGATEVVPETLEAQIMIVAHALTLLGVPSSRIMRRMRALRLERYRLLQEFFQGGDLPRGGADAESADRLQPVPIPPDAYAAGRTLEELDLGRDHVLVTSIARDGKRRLGPDPATRLASGDVVVLFGAPEDLRRADLRLLGRQRPGS